MGPHFRRHNGRKSAVDRGAEGTDARAIGSASAIEKAAQQRRTPKRKRKITSGIYGHVWSATVALSLFDSVSSAVGNRGGFPTIYIRIHDRLGHHRRYLDSAWRRRHCGRTNFRRERYSISRQD